MIFSTEYLHQWLLISISRHDICSLYPSMLDISISTEGIKNLLDKINSNKATGPDRLRPRVLKELASSVLSILEELFTASLHQCAVPDDWKLAMITPVYKKGDRNCPMNYRPTSLTCICSKLREHMFTTNLTPHFTEYNIFYNLQHGFRRECLVKPNCLNALQPYKQM